jgi:hypothetical protein
MTHAQFRRYVAHVTASPPVFLRRGTRLHKTGADELTLKTTQFVPYQMGRSPGGITEVTVRLVYRKGRGVVLEAVVGAGRYPEAGFAAVLRFEEMAGHSYSDEIGLELLLP